MLDTTDGTAAPPRASEAGDAPDGPRDGPPAADDGTARTASFYSALAPYYDAIFEDFDAASSRQASQLSSIILSQLPPGTAPRDVPLLDAACGIGTQLLGLLRLGYPASGADLSPGAVARCAELLAERGVAARELRGACDMRSLRPGMFAGAPFKALVCADNCIPHLPADPDILRALRAFLLCLAPGGVCIVTLRDYDNESRERLQLRPYPGIRERPGGGRTFVFQTWAFDDPARPDVYSLGMYFVEDSPGGVGCRSFKAEYRMVGVGRVLQLMKEAGFEGVGRVEGDGGYFQPVLVGRKPEA
ncbi:S-adenosyl-L-methionine-dependent methyltransferase [Hyaloraphidium curvatum]|nr:S-adenosyl-L-methionine-dependent methyltransferase [Hyaloraphidium curvatum]